MLNNRLTRITNFKYCFFSCSSKGVTVLMLVGYRYSNFVVPNSLHFDGSMYFISISLRHVRMQDCIVRRKDQ